MQRTDRSLFSMRGLFATNGRLKSYTDLGVSMNKIFDHPMIDVLFPIGFYKLHVTVKPV